jgi:hypothetical protein
VLGERSKIKSRAMERRKKEYLAGKAAQTENCLLAKVVRCPDHFADVQVAYDLKAFRGKMPEGGKKSDLMLQERTHTSQIWYTP